jgi:hypothetical protein
VNSLAVRAALVVIALLVGAWLALGVRAIDLEGNAKAVTDLARAGAATPADLQRARDDLHKAELLSPSKDPLIRQGELMAAVGRPVEAAILGYAATLKEPDNLQAWFLVWANEQDPAKKGVAQARLLELNPWFAYALRRRPSSPPPPARD